MKWIKSFSIDSLLITYLLMVAYKIVYVRWIIEERYPEFHWNQLYLALALGGVVGGILQLCPQFSLGRLTQGLVAKKPEGSYWYHQQYFIYVLIIATFIAGMEMGQVSFFEFFSPQGMQGAKRIFLALLTPEWSILTDAIVLALETIYMAFMATFFAIPVAFLLSFFSSRNLMSHSAICFTSYNVFRFFTNVTRSLEPILWAIIFSVWVGIGPFAGMLALFVHSVASLTKLYSEQIESIDYGPLEAMTSTGAHPIQVIWFGVVPQVILPFLGFTIYRWDINVRMATVIGLVGGGGIGTMLMQYSQAGKWNETGLLAIIIFLIVWSMDYASSKIRATIR